MVNERALLCELRRPAGLWPRELLRISIMVPGLLSARLLNPTRAHGRRSNFQVTGRTKHKLTPVAGREEPLMKEGQDEVTVMEEEQEGKGDLMRVFHDDPMRFNSAAGHSWGRRGVGVNYLGHS